MRRRSRASIATGAVALALLLLVGAPVGRSAPPVLPVGDGAELVAGLSAPTLAPGQSGTIALTLADPLAAAITGLTLTLELYAFNAYPGNASGPVPSDAPTLSAGGAPSRALTIPIAELDPGAPRSISVEVATDGAVPSGDFVVRIHLAFLENGTSYLFESRGYFSNAAWANATVLPGGGSTLNLSRLGVSGVVPETAVLVRANPFPTVLVVVLVGAIVLAAAGGYVAWRPRGGSRDGATDPGPESQAPRALGKRRTRDGD